MRWLMLAEMEQNNLLYSVVPSTEAVEVTVDHMLTAVDKATKGEDASAEIQAQ